MARHLVAGTWLIAGWDDIKGVSSSPCARSFHGSSSAAGGRPRSAKIGDMGEALSDIARKALAVVVLVVAAYILFKMVLGFVAAIAWIVVAIVAVIAVIWALRVL